MAYGTLQDVKTALLEMVSRGDAPGEIICHIAEALGELSGEEDYAGYIKAQLQTVYGLVLDNKELLVAERQETEKRLTLIRKALKEPGFSSEEKKRMEFAIRNHETRLSKLDALIAEENHTIQT